MKKLLVVFLMIFSVKAIAAESVHATIIGLNLGMTSEELVAVIEKTTPLKCRKTHGIGKNQGRKGYCCAKKNSCRYFKYQHQKGINIIQALGKKVVDKIDISCDITKTCGFDMKEIKDMILERGIIDNLEYEFVAHWKLPQYRGRDGAGNFLIINATYYGGDGRGKYGWSETGGISLARMWGETHLEENTFIQSHPIVPMD